MWSTVRSLSEPRLPTANTSTLNRVRDALARRPRAAAFQAVPELAAMYARTKTGDLGRLVYWGALWISNL